MPSPSDVFILSAVQASDPADALRQAIKESGVKPARVQDLLFAWDGSEPADAEELARSAGLECPAVAVSSSLRALFFAAQSILCGDAELVLVGGAQDGQSAALLLAGPAAVGVYNLLPLARIDARSLNGAGAALKQAEISHEDVEIRLEGTCGALLVVQLVAELQEREMHWGMVSVAGAAMLIQRV
jgi:acetyl-CoA acetyltransferase